MRGGDSGEGGSPSLDGPKPECPIDGKPPPISGGAVGGSGSGLRRSDGETDGEVLESIPPPPLV